MTWHGGQDNGIQGPYRLAKAVTPSDTADLPSGVCSAIYCSGAGNINVTLEGGDTAVFAITAGWANLTKLLVRRVLSTSTTASGILALY